jgi:hypothetical protein
MAMFAEDIGLLPRHAFTLAVEDVVEGHGSSYDLLFELFREMNSPAITPAGRFKGTPYFSGGLFSQVEPFELTTEEITALGLACQEDWAQVRPVIFGTLRRLLHERSRHREGGPAERRASVAPAHRGG